MKKYIWPLVTFACVALMGCTQMPMSYQPTLKNIETIRASNMAAVNVGTFALAPGKDATIDTSIHARGSAAVPPEGTFSGYLKTALMQDIQAAGKYDPASPIVISGLLTDNSLQAPMGTGKGTLGAIFSVQREGQSVYQKELNETAEWPSSFIGAEAIPTALSEYASLYKKLLRKLFSDDDFQKATQAK